MSIKDWPNQERPREKLLAQGAMALSDAELLALFLRTGTRNHTAVDLGRELLKKFNNLRTLLEIDADTFCQLPGLGITKYIELQAALELGRRHLATSLQQSTILDNSTAVKSYLTAQLRHYRYETFGCLFLNNQLELIRFERLFQGTINKVTVFPRTLIMQALTHNAAAVVLAHNHPSGHTTPSQNDIELTREIHYALTVIDIRLIDHLIIGNEGAYSMAEHGDIS